jgi:hypothetical protein
VVVAFCWRWDLLVVLVNRLILEEEKRHRDQLKIIPARLKFRRPGPERLVQSILAIKAG